MLAELAGAASLGLLCAVSPCPLATNVAAVGFLGRHAGSPSRTLRAGGFFVAGRSVVYTALAAGLAGGLVAASALSSSLNATFGFILGPLFVITGGVLLGLIPLPNFGGSLTTRFTEALGRRGDGLGAFALGALFALSFCPASAALFFGGLVPLAAEAGAPLTLAATFGIATGLPVLGFAVLIAGGGHQLGARFGQIQAIEVWLRRGTGAFLLGLGLYMSVTQNFGG